MSNFNPERYTISIKLENINGDELYVARVNELPDITEYADSYEYAKELILDAITTSKEAFDEMGINFPSPQIVPVENNFFSNGKISLCLSRSQHEAISTLAKHDGVSVDYFITNLISEKIGEEKGSLKNIIDEPNKSQQEPSLKIELTGHSIIQGVIMAANMIKTENNDITISLTGCSNE